MKSLKLLALVSVASLAVITSGCQKNASDSNQTPGTSNQTETTNTMPSETTTTLPAQGAAATPGANGQQAANSGASALRDAEITTKVKAALIGTSDLKSMQINVDTNDGTVTLSGAIDSQQNIDRAAQVAQAVSGVKTVKNQLTVKTQG